MSCGTRALDSRPGDPDGAWLLRSSLWYRSVPNFPVRAPAADAFTGVLLTDFAAARQFIPAGPLCLSGLREKPYPRQLPNVYSGHHRFLKFRGRGNLHRARGSYALTACWWSLLVTWMLRGLAASRTGMVRVSTPAA